VTERPALDLEEARRRLRELGYLDGGVERFVFARALEGRRGVLVPAALAGALAFAVADVAATACSEADFAARVGGPAWLLLHLFLAFLLPAVAVSLLVAAAADRSRSPAGAAMAFAMVAAALVFGLWIAATSRLGGSFGTAAAVWAIPVALSAVGLARSVRSGYLARAFAHSRTLPPSRQRGVFMLVPVAGVIAAAFVLAGRPEPPPPPLHVSGGRPPVVVVAVDGVSIEPSVAGASSLDRLLARAASGWWTGVPGDPSPPELWTTVATGVYGRRHGVRALERVRPAGSPSALRPPLGAAWYLQRIGPSLSLVSGAPVSASDRRAPTFWEVAASAGLPSAAIGWWASGPWPGADVLDNRELLGGAGTGEEADTRALEELEKRRGRAITTAYLPGPDILRDHGARRSEELSRIARFLEGHAARAAAGEIVLIVVALASHESVGAPGGVFAFDGATPPAAKWVRIRPTDVAPSILARAGVPAALDLDGRPVAALFPPGTLETLTVPTYGSRRVARSDSPATTDRDYLKKLKALGYLN
jgi:hypothetical protein